MNWIKSAGGPLIVAEQDLALAWRGISGSSVSSEVKTKNLTDYSRACSVQGYIGIVEIDGGSGLVLGDMPLATSFWINSAGYLHLVRAFYMDLDEDVPSLLSQFDENVEKELVSVDFDISDDSVMIFDSALYGKNILSENLQLSTTPGKFRILTYEFKPNLSAFFLLHKFQPYD